MKKLAFILVLVILILIPPHSRVVESQCAGYISGMCLPHGAVPVEQSLTPDDEGGS
jgi:hypothetical protein